MPTLYYYPGNASMAPHMVLKELGIDFDLALVDRKTDAQKAPDYLRLNPAGRIPALADGDLVLFESAAISLYLAEKNPEASLIPVTLAVRGLFHQWLFYLATTWQGELMIFFYPEKHTTDDAGVEAIKAAQEARLADIMGLVDTALAGKDFLVGEAFSLCDIYLVMLSSWSTALQKSWKDFANLERVVSRLIKRPAIRDVLIFEDRLGRFE